MGTYAVIYYVMGVVTFIQSSLVSAHTFIVQINNKDAFYSVQRRVLFNMAKKRLILKFYIMSTR